MPVLRRFTPADLAWAHALNQDNRIALSDETPESFAARVERAAVALVAGDDLGFLLAFTRKPAAQSFNFDWLAARVANFIYVDRVAVAAHARGQGVARSLYNALFLAAAELGAARITCEVNSDPPNPASDAFHGALGFRELGQALLPDGSKRVRFLVRELSP